VVVVAALNAEERIKVYLEDAKRFLEEALREFEEGVRSGDVIRIRDAAEKAWNSIVQSTNALLLKLVGKVPSSHWERRRLLREIEKDPSLAEFGFRDRYAARERYLHELVFYEGIVDVEDVKFELEKTHRYIEEVEKILRERYR